MLFFGIIIVVSTFVLIQTRMIESSIDVYAQNEKEKEMLLTDITILNVSFDNTTDPDTTTTYIENSGKIKIDIEHLDLYMDQAKIPRLDANRTIVFVQGHDTFNPLEWDPDEQLHIEIFMDLQNITHALSTTTDNGGTDTALFNI